MICKHCGNLIVKEEGTWYHPAGKNLKLAFCANVPNWDNENKWVDYRDRHHNEAEPIEMVDVLKAFKNQAKLITP